MEHDQAVITLLTDFGLTDVYVGAMKGVILSRCPGAVIVDLTHAVEPGNLHAAAHLLGVAWRHFPKGTVHTVVVDPGVGSDRRILAARLYGQIMLAPDNGVLSRVFEDCEPDIVVSVENEAMFLQPVSNTFHGRDIFAPVAAALAGGAPLDQLGPTVDRWVHLPRLDPRRLDDGRLEGQVVHIDSFGNLITNFESTDVPATPCVSIQGVEIAGLCTSYAEVDTGQALAIIGSGGRLEISINEGHAADRFNANVGTPVCLGRAAVEEV
ncbi:MAG: SAM hydrolase/SAM-dependent halogenase family protein [Planctomycetota bacterium]|jgi:S-adenosylmethionine hydrolase